VEKVVSGGYDLEEFFIGLIEHLRNLLIVCSTGSTELIEVSEEHKKQYVETARNFKEEDLLRLIRIVADTSVSLKRSINPRIPLETAMITMIKLDKTVVIEDLLTRLDGLQKGAEKKEPVTHSETRMAENVSAQGRKSETKAENRMAPQKDKENNDPSNTEKKKIITLRDVQSQWIKIVEKVKHKKITVGSFIQEGVVLDVRDNDIEIAFGLSNGFHIDSIMRSKNLVLDALHEIFGSGVTFHCVKKDLPHKDIIPASKKMKAERLNTLKEENPFIQKIVDSFDGEIVD
jgi:DNA polymerase-3 subunit gamma/tau